MTFPEKQQQIVQTHAGLINAVVEACENRELLPQLEPILCTSEANGWRELVAGIRRVIAGERDTRTLRGLDDEDRIIVEAILRGLQDPRSLPDVDIKPDPLFAAPGLASLIAAAGRGDVSALEMLSNMAEQMRQVGGEMTRVGASLLHLLNGDRDADRLCQNVGTHGRQLLLSVLDELRKLDRH